MLGLIAGGGAAALATSAGALFWLRGRAPTVTGLRLLSAHEYRTFGALATALLPPGGAFPEGAEVTDLPRAFDAFLADEPPWNQADLKAALALLEFSPVLYSRRFATFSNLPAEERLAIFKSWQEGTDDLRRAAATALRRFIFLVYYDTPAVWPRLGYEGPLFTGRPT